MRPPVPKYFTITAVLRARLERECAPGARVPSEAELCRDFRVSRATIQQALSLLGREGLIRRQQGRGTFYRGPAVPRTETKPGELLEVVMRREGFTRVVRKGIVVAPPRVAERLHLPAASPVVALDRVGYVDDGPIVYIQGYLPLDVGVHVLDADEALRHRSVASLLRDRHHVPIEQVFQTIGASLADPAYARALGVEVGAPVLEGERTYLDDRGRTVFFAITFYRADRHRFAIHIENWRGEWDDDARKRPAAAGPSPAAARRPGARISVSRAAPRRARRGPPARVPRRRA
jgi:GntR family transcriptional regulator